MTNNTTSTATAASADPLLCSACSVSFHTSLQRREHMKTEWHVANVKRRAASLPSISQEHYEEGKEASPATRPLKSSLISRQSDDEQEDDESFASDSSDASQEETHLDSARCLFCLHESAAIDANISHMVSTHDFRIPEIDKLQEGLEPLLWYLDLVINRFYSCLYCGHTKSSAEATRAHMLDKGHCMLDMSPNSEYMEFWDQAAEAVHAQDSKNEAQPKMISHDELALDSGRIIISRKNRLHSQRRNKLPRKDETALIKIERPEDPGPDHMEQNDSKDVQLLSNRDHMGLVGLSNAEQRLILATEKRMRSQSSRKWSARHWTTENVSTSIKRTVFKQNISGG